MTQQEIISGNKLIAEFMGAKKTGASTSLGNGKISNEYRVNVTEQIEAIFYDKEGAWNDFKDLKFHSSWDWLMPVVEKIESLSKNPCIQWWATIYANTCSIADEDENVICDVPANTKIEATWKAVIDFITWHNQNKTI